MPNKIKYSKAKRREVARMYAVDREGGGLNDDGTRSYSTGRYTLRRIAEKTGVHISSVYAIATGQR